MSDPLRPPADMGRFEGTTHVRPVRVYYEDTDASGIVYHARYLHFLERGRSDSLRLAGLDHAQMLKAADPAAWAIRRMTIDWMKPALLDDEIHVLTRYRALTGARLFADQEIVRGAETLIRAAVEAVVIGLDGRPRRVPAAYRDLLAQFLGT